MENNNDLEVILFSKYLFTDARQKEQVRWIGTTLQSAIGRQQDKAGKLFLRTLKDTPPIYLS